MVEIAGGAEWDFAFDLLGAETVGAVNFASAEAEIDFVFGGTNFVAAVFCVLLKTELLVGGSLKFVECNTDNAHWTWQFGVKLASEACYFVVSIKSFFADKLAVVVTV